ncbi:GFA family protein [Roseibium sp.]|uniref:GFA family protein n=1 Tax=Roseibium sp. TaxID=1936156 RepID=UPI003BAA60B6
MNAESPKWLTGSCNCGRATYRVRDDFEYAQNCHCSGCRKATGSAFKPFGGIRREQFEVHANGNKLLRIGSEVDQDVRCADCGAFLYSVVRHGSYVHVAYGSLNNEPTLKPEGHIFVGSKASWHTITDDLPQYEELPPA